MLTGISCRQLRVQLGWSTYELARRSKVPFADVVAFERINDIGHEHKTKLEQTFRAGGADVDANTPQGAREKRELP